MSKNKQKVWGYCYYCGLPATSYEHVPPQCIYDRTIHFNNPPIKVPSCDKHNNKKSKNDELFAFYAINDPVDNTFMQSEPHERLRRGRKRRPKLIRNILKNAFNVDIHTTSGIYTNTLPAIPVYYYRIFDSLDRITRGLFFHEFRERIPDDFEVCVLEEKLGLFANEREEIMSMDMKVIQDNIFAYTFFVDNNNNYRSIWKLRFGKSKLIVTETKPYLGTSKQ
jgi:hypothetical protein